MGVLVAEAVESLWARAHQEVDEGLLPSCQVALAIDGEVAEVRTFGDTPRGDGSRYLMYSATKAVVSAAVLHALGDGSLKLTGRAADVLPSFAANGKDDVTVEQVMPYTSAAARAPMGPNDWGSHEQRVAKLASWRLDGDLGRADYHVTSAHWVLAALLEAVDGIDFRESVRRRVLEPSAWVRCDSVCPKPSRSTSLDLSPAANRRRSRSSGQRSVSMAPTRVRPTTRVL